MKRLILILLSIAIALPLLGTQIESSDLTVKNRPNTFYFFHSSRCPHCKDAAPFIKKLEKEYPSIRFLNMEILGNPEYRQLFQNKIKAMNIKGAGVPTFVLGENSVIGYKQGRQDKMLRKMIDNYIAGTKSSEKQPKA
ncbi:thioredoxin family protein, partial [bacterium]|nr:thioredoxin family protein [bacterium]